MEAFGSKEIVMKIKLLHLIPKEIRLFLTIINMKLFINPNSTKAITKVVKHFTQQMQPDRECQDLIS